ncbi:MAG: lipoate--protein ligase [Eubacteriales bacterium]|nr:lipoate--protein ligase [Eubacteriales bacterium]
MSMVYLESPSTDPDFNLALEQYVFDKLPRSNEYFMLWQNDNAIIVGKHQNTLEEINQAYVREHRIRVVRRLSGGGAVYHDLGNINYTFIVDAKGSKSLDFAVFCRQVVKALATLGVRAEVSGRNDITIGGKKFSGNSQYIKKGRIMHHGTIMFDSDLAVVAAALKVGKDKIQSKGVKSVRARVTNVREHIKGDITLAQFWHVLRQFMVEEQNMSAYQLTGADLAQIEELRQSRYATWAWNYGVSPKYSIRKERRVEGCGIIKIGMEVEKGVITAFSTHGDYFGSGDSADVANLLVGEKAEEQALLKALAALPIDYYYNNLTSEELVDIILK